MLKWIVVLVLAAIATVLALAATKPDAFRVERRIRIGAPAERVFGDISDFRHWKAWSPWEKKDPAMQAAYGGAASGPGATYEWSGNGAVGQGRMEIVEAVPPGRLRIKLDFTKPMEAHNEVVFTLVQDGAATEVSWVMSGANNLASKVMQVFVSMDRMVGGDFEAGLAALKAKAEAAGG